jgi:hypothetical protein
MKDALFHVQKNGKVGFINKKGQVIIDFEFDGASHFSEGIARVFYKDRVGCINTKGNLVIPIQFEDMRAFSEGLAAVKVSDKWGYINKQGEIIIPPIFYVAEKFQNGFAKVREDMFTAGSFINRERRTVLAKRVALTSAYCEELINCKEEDEKWGYMNISGEIIVKPIFAYAHPFNEGKAAVEPVPLKRKHKRDEHFYGFVDKNGEMVIPPIYQGADLKFSEDLCAVWNNKFGYIDPAGELVIPYEFNLGQHFLEDMACVQLTENGKYGFINRTGSAIIPPTFDSANSFENGLAAVYLRREFGKTLSGYINKNGDYVWEPSR